MATFDATKNFAKVTTSTGYDDAAVSIVLSSGDGDRLPQPSTDGEFNLVWWNNTSYGDPSDDPNREIVRCTARTADTLTVTRAQESTTASIKNAVGKTYRMALPITAKVIDDITAAFARRIVSIVSSATITPTGDTADDYNVTALAVNATIAAPSGTPVNGQSMIIRVKDDGTARTLTWNAIYRVIGTTLPVTTVAGKTDYFGLKYNSADTKWDVLAVGEEA